MVDAAEIVPNYIVEEEEDDEDIYDPWCTIAKIRRHMKYLLPHIFLILSFFFYIFLGASYFYYHESAFEVESKTSDLAEFQSFQRNFSEKIWTLHNSNDAISREKFDTIQKELFDDLVSKIFLLQRNQFINEKNLFNQNTTDNLLWSFSNSIFFATSVVTTIGYTNKLAPATIYGKIGVIILAMFGIPLFVITVGDIGKFMSEFLLGGYEKFVAIKKKMLLRRRVMPEQVENANDRNNWPHNDPSIPPLLVFLITIMFIGISGSILSFWKGWSLLDGCFICFNVMARIGTGNKIPSEDDNIVFIILYIILGIAWATMVIDLAGVWYIRRIHWLGRKSKNICCLRRRRNSVNPEGRC